MAAAGTGAVFFLGTRAHYQVLQQPESRYDAENGNASSETIYQNPTVQGLWNKDHQPGGYMNGGGYRANGTGPVCLPEDKEVDVKRRDKRRPSETAPCEDLKPAALNNIDNTNAKSKQSRVPFFAFLASLSRRKKKCRTEQLQHLESALLTTCTYRESCRCLDCQSRYFECDEPDEDYSNSEDESEYLHYLAQAMKPPPAEDSDDDDDEVFVDKVPEDSTSTDLLLRMSVSSSESEPEEGEPMNIEVAAGAPILFTFLMSHPITCAIQ